MINVDVSVNNYLIRVSSKIIIFGKLVHKIASMIKRVILVNIQILKIVLPKNAFFDKSVFACTDEMRNTTDATVNELTYAA